MNALWILLIYLVWSYLHIIIHEAGHAVVGNLLGYNVRAIMIGSKRPLITFKLRRIAVQLNLSNKGGLTWGMNSPLKAYVGSK